MKQIFTFFVILTLGYKSYSQNNKTLHFNIASYNRNIRNTDNSMQAYTYIIDKIDSSFNAKKENDGYKYFILCTSGRFFQTNSLFDEYCNDYYRIQDTIVTFLNPIAIHDKLKGK